MKIKKITGFVCAFLFAHLSFGQVTLEHTYKNSVNPLFREYGEDLACNYVTADTTGVITIYDLDHSISKTIKIEIPENVKMSSINVYSMYSNVINTDPLLELYYIMYFKNSNRENCYVGGIMNEKGELIKKFEDSWALQIIATTDGFKLENFVTRDGCEIYDLPTTPNKISAPQSGSVKLPYPNPANQVINIPYELSGQWGIVSIYNATGQLVEQKNVDKNFGNLLLNVSDYAKGMYFYKVDKQKGEFMVK